MYYIPWQFINCHHILCLLEEIMKKLLSLASVLVLASLVLTACGGGGASSASDLLGAIQERGYILVSTDPNYEPQSFLNTEGSRPSDTKCPSDALTTAEMQGFDVDVAIAIGDGLAQQVLGHGLAARLSTRLGEGVINGLMTARIGIAAMDLCRPLPFRATKRPGIGDFIGDLTPSMTGKDRDRKG